MGRTAILLWIDDTRSTRPDRRLSGARKSPATSWASDIGADLFTDTCRDGVTRRYARHSDPGGATTATQLAGGPCKLHRRRGGWHGIRSRILRVYRHSCQVDCRLLLGARLTTPQFLFPDGVTLVDRILGRASRSAASGGHLPAGLVGATLTTNPSATSSRGNICGGCSSRTISGIVKVLDRRSASNSSPRPAR
jgi:hypothetical protein